jgi:hypothetical protein
MLDHQGMVKMKYSRLSDGLLGCEGYFNSSAMVGLLVSLDFPGVYSVSYSTEDIGSYISVCTDGTVSTFVPVEGDEVFVASAGICIRTLGPTATVAEIPSESDEFTLSSGMTRSSRFTVSQPLRETKGLSNSIDFSKSDIFNPSSFFPYSNLYGLSQSFIGSSPYPVSAAFIGSATYKVSRSFIATNIYRGSGLFVG